MKYGKILRMLGTVVLAFCMVVPAFAGGDAQSAKKYLTADGRKYSTYAYIATGDKKYIESRVWVNTDDGKTTPSGYMGAAVYLYGSDGYLVDSSSMEYNDSETSGVGFGFLTERGLGGTYYTWGKTEVYVPSKGKYISTNVTSPKQNRSSGNFVQDLVDEFYEAVENNSMIKAMTIDGLKGWVYAKDLQSEEAISLEDVEAVNKQNSKDRYVNVYGDDGTTVIGQFKISSGQSILE